MRGAAVRDVGRTHRQKAERQRGGGDEGAYTCRGALARAAGARRQRHGCGREAVADAGRNEWAGSEDKPVARPAACAPQRRKASNARAAGRAMSGECSFAGRALGEEVRDECESSLSLSGLAISINQLTHTGASHTRRPRRP